MDIRSFLRVFLVVGIVPMIFSGCQFFGEEVVACDKIEETRNDVMRTHIIKSGGNRSAHEMAQEVFEKSYKKCVKEGEKTQEECEEMKLRMEGIADKAFNSQRDKLEEERKQKYAELDEREAECN